MSNSERKSSRIPTGLLPSRRGRNVASVRSIGRLAVGRLSGAPRLPKKPNR